jgi:hypothetical protein
VNRASHCLHPKLTELPFDSAEFPFALLQAFANKETTLKPLCKGGSDNSDLGGVLPTNNIDIATRNGRPYVVAPSVEGQPGDGACQRRASCLRPDGDLFEAGTS